MCTAIKFKAKDFYFGRTLDVEQEIPTQIVVCPRNFKFQKDDKGHFAMIGMAMVFSNYPLFFEATNEFGLSMAGLLFPQHAEYFEEQENKINLEVHQLIPHILGKCKNCNEAKNEFKKINIVKPKIKGAITTPMHWIVCDKEESITIEQTKEGLKILENKIEVLTNSPNFDWHLTNLNNYLNLSASTPTNRMSNNYELKTYCAGMGALGLPGDLSSSSRFVRAVFTKENAIIFENEEQNVMQFFHILETVNQTLGVNRTKNGLEQTVYTSCCNANLGKYYYKTYFNSEINCVDMHRTNLDDNKLFTFEVKKSTKINYQN